MKQSKTKSVFASWFNFDTDWTLINKQAKAIDDENGQWKQGIIEIFAVKKILSNVCYFKKKNQQAQ